MLSFVILHYNSLSDTQKCIKSILTSLNKEEISIIIVDNASIDHGGKFLEDQYKNEKNVHVIMNNENYGFSKGNNIGCTYAKEYFNPDFICVINNDIFIDSVDFVKVILEKYNETKFDVLGPHIWNTKRRYNQNPIQVISSLKEVNDALKRTRFSEKLLSSKAPILYYLYNRFYKPKPRLKKGLHGAALIFSKKYLDRYSTTFPEITFMYGEEHLLYYRKIIDKLIFQYEPNLKVFHNHSASTSKSVKGVVGKWKFQQKYMKTALLELKEIYENNYRI